MVMTAPVCAGCKFEQPQTLMGLASFFPNLDMIDASEVEAFNSSVIVGWARHLHRLRSLTAQRCQSQRFLLVSPCPFPGLARLDLKGCRGLDGAELVGPLLPIAMSPPPPPPPPPPQPASASQPYRAEMPEPALPAVHALSLSSAGSSESNECQGLDDAGSIRLPLPLATWPMYAPLSAPPPSPSPPFPTLIPTCIVFAALTSQRCQGQQYLSLMPCPFPWPLHWDFCRGLNCAAFGRPSACNRPPSPPLLCFLDRSCMHFCMLAMPVSCILKHAFTLRLMYETGTVYSSASG